MNKVKVIKNDKGINFGAIPNKLSKENLKYVLVEYPLSIIRSKKLTALKVKAISDNPKRTIKNVLNISIKKF
tara:strand:+ start:1376 stop:1591 length:216 start_codon:yes stop_codon:yes gene_type:complete